MVEFFGGLFGPLVDVLGAGLMLVHGWGAPWWLSIVVLTLVVRTALLPLTVQQVRNVRRLQELRPDLEKIQKRYANKPHELRQKMVELYSERRVNPLGGCLPLLVQMPVFLGLFYTIREFEALESFASGGLWWFADLAAPDPLFILPVLYALTMMAAQEIPLRQAASGGRQLVRLLAPASGLFMALAGFPAGLFVYWISNNLITLVLNIAIYRPF